MIQHTFFPFIEPPEKCIGTAKREKKKKYLNACLNERRPFTPFFASSDGLLGV